MVKLQGTTLCDNAQSDSRVAGGQRENPCSGGQSARSTRDRVTSLQSTAAIIYCSDET